jgi:hypothetical protein
MIYYTFFKATGEYSGSGTPFIENETHGSTEITIPEYDENSGLTPFFDGEKWELN